MNFETLEQTELDENARARIEEGEKAARRMAKGEHLDDWIALGACLMEGRRLCMRLSNSNAPTGRRYADTFRAWLTAHKALNTICGTKNVAVSAVLWLYEDPTRLAMLQEMRQVMTPLERARLGSPITARQKIEARLKAHGIVEEAAAPKEPKLDWKERALRAEKALAEQGGEFSSEDSVTDIVDVLDRTMSAAKMDSLAAALRKAAKEKRARFA